MEFFRIVEVNTTEEEIQKTLTLDDIEKISEQLIHLEPISERVAYTGTVWGEFHVSRDQIKGGVRFALDDCPNALTWTITTGYPPARENIVIHLTINRQRKKEEFIEEIEEFLDDQLVCLGNLFSSKTVEG